ncbi:MAG: four helix bundle protein [Opitutales bacterium]
MAGGLKSFEELHCWQQAQQLNRSIYQVSSKGPPANDFPLREQIRRSSISVMSNIAKDFASGSDVAFARFLRYSLRSAAELKCQLYIAEDLEYIAQDELADLFE